MYLSVSVDIHFVDSLTHALAISIIFAALGSPDLIPFAVLGAVIPDIDVIFQRFSDTDPRLYIFTHGGITHSLIGAGMTSLIFSGIGLIVAIAAFPSYAGFSPLMAISAALLGALSHLMLDYLAYPGIPLLYPYSDHKYTMGIMAGPSIFLTVASICYLVLTVAGKASIGDAWPYVLFFAVVILASIALKVYISSKVKGKTIPGFIPVSWLIVSETSGSIRVLEYSLLKGVSEGAIYDKYRGHPPGLQPDNESPELRRMRYHSYTVTEEYGGDAIRYSDPLREHGHLWYPPYFKSVRVPVKKTHGR